MNRLRSCLALLALTLLVACPEPPPDPPITDGVVWDEDRGLLLLRGGDVLLELPLSAFQLGEVDALDDRMSYDPFWSDDSLPLVAEVQWRRAIAAELQPPAAPLVLDARLTLEGGGAARLTVTAVADGNFAASLVPEPGPTFAYVRLEPTVDPTEAFYGLGSALDSPEHRGRVRAMQLEVEVGVESLYNEAHVPVPLLIGTRGWGLFVQDKHPGLWEVATEADDLVRVTFGTGAATAEGLRFHLYSAAHPLDITAEYYRTTGAPRLPAPWALGPWVWRDENTGDAQVFDDIETLRDLDLATSGIWIDRPFAAGVNSFDWHPDHFADAEAMIQRAHALGLRVGLWQAPYFDPEDAAELHQRALDEGWFPPRAPPALNNWSVLVDLTNPDAYAGYQDLIRRYTAQGIEGWKLDYAEDVVLGLNGGRLSWEFSDGSDERTMHRDYTLLYHRVYAETLPPDGGFLLVRSGTYGDQAHGAIVWPGDLDATLDLRGAPAEAHGEEFDAVGGLPASLVYGLSLGPSGFAFYGSDTGGYRHSPPNKETFTRWFQQTALSTVMQIGTSSNDVAWEPTATNGFDTEMLDWYRDFVRLHARLFPYLWTYARQLPTTGRAIMRPYGLARPELGLHPTDTYFLGDHLLVAPVVLAGATSRQVPFPPGRWVDWFTGEVLQGEQTVDAPLSKLPLYLAEGGIVPLLRPTIDSLAPTTEPARVDSYADDPGILWARVFPGAAGRFALWDGTSIEQDAGTVRTASGSEFVDGFVLELFDQDRPASVQVGGAAVDEAPAATLPASDSGWAWDGERRLLSVRVPPGAQVVEVQR